MGPVFGEVLKTVSQTRPDLRVVIPTTANVADIVADMTSGWPCNPMIINPNKLGPSEFKQAKKAAFGAANWALATSGTVSLELAATQTPMVIAYDMNWLSRQIIGRMLKVDTTTLVNLVSDTRAVPEFLGERCRADLIAPELMKVIEGDHKQAEAMQITMERLGRGDEAPGLRAARAVLGRMESV